MEDNQNDDLANAREKKQKTPESPKMKTVKLTVVQVLAFRGTHTGINKLMQAEKISMPLKFKLFSLRNQIIDHHEAKALFKIVDDSIDAFVKEHERQPMIGDLDLASLFQKDLNIEVDKVFIPANDCPQNVTSEDMSMISWIFEFEEPKEETEEKK